MQEVRRCNGATVSGVLIPKITRPFQRVICATFRSTAYIIVASIVVVFSSSLACAQGKVGRLVLDEGEFQSIEDLPAAFGKFVNLHLTKITLSRRGPVVARRLSGTIDAGGVNDLELRSLVMSGRALKLETRPHGGASYTFTGRFPENYPLDEHGAPTRAVLTGTIIKTQQGKETARATVSFRYQYYSD